MKRIFVYLLLIILSFNLVHSFSPYKEECSQCGFSDLTCDYPHYNKTCIQNAFSYTCRIEKVKTGFIFCPSCENGYYLEKCTSDWFGLIKNSHCVKDRLTECGGSCNKNELVYEIHNCTRKTYKVCCKIPQNKITINYPENGSNIDINKTFNISLSMEGLVKKLNVDFGDGKKVEINVDTNKTKNDLIISYLYPYMGIYTIKVRASYDNQTSKDETTVYVGIKH